MKQLCSGNSCLMRPEVIPAADKIIHDY